MAALLSALVAVLFAAGLYMMLRRDVVKIAIGLALLGHAANLLIFSAGGVSRRGTPVIAAGRAALDASHPDPLPQAMILTAIVIGFGVLAFALVLISRAVSIVGSGDVERYRSTDP